MKSVWADPWVQSFGLLAALSAGFFFYGRKVPASGRRWIVDARLAKDADTANLAQAVAQAADGDAIYVRAGVYKGSLVLSRSVRLVGLAPTAAGVVVESDAGRPGIALSSAVVVLENLTVRGEGVGVEVSGGAELRAQKLELIGNKGCGLRVRAASAVLRSSALTLNGCGARLEAAAILDAQDSDFSGNLDGPLLVAPNDRRGVVVRQARNKPQDLESQGGLGPSLLPKP